MPVAEDAQAADFSDFSLGDTPFGRSSASNRIELLSSTPSESDHSAAFDQVNLRLSMANVRFCLCESFAPEIIAEPTADK